MRTDPNTIQSLIICLWQHINSRRRRQFSLLVVLMVLSSFAEIISIGAVLPFLGVLTAPEQVFGHATAQPFVQALGLSKPEQLLLPLTIAFGLAAVIAGIMRLTLLWASTRLSFATGADLSINIYRRTLYQPYAVHCARNSSEVITGISTKANQVIYQTIVPILTLISSSIMLVVILVALMLVDPKIALITFGGFGLIYAFIIRVTRKHLLTGSQRIAHESTQVIKSLQEGLGGIRDVLIDGNQATYCQVYRNADLPLRRAQGNNLFISSSPRFGMEALGMLLIALLAYSLAQKEDGIAQAIPVLGALALGAQRLLPVLQQAYGAWSQIRGGQISLQDTLALLGQPLPTHANYPIRQALTFQRHIQLQHLAFRYSTATPWVLRDINLNIYKGSRIGFIGATGSGKSTLIDIIMGLLEPTEGVLAIDGQLITPENQRAWQQHIAHVPQSIFLADSTVAENIAFGVPKNQIDHQRVLLAAQQAQIAVSIESWPKQYQTFVGERGIRLSGGQRQRIGIARALYKQADVIVFDEATSALDTDTEQAVMQAIENLSKDLTLIVIAHRLTTLKNCTQIVELGDGHIKRIGSYQTIISDSINTQSNAKEQQSYA
ncbi:ABC transporter ATP-binding protein [Thiolinea disciformis]|uniref:ABC transporter ATP-binding protein n=1 Tax=Thiolinea disciformis TaxID=125614 RepID=UPI00036F43E5|nr:ABC transporter ATP-binding protein [Thiolinea disciformis]